MFNSCFTKEKQKEETYKIDVNIIDGKINKLKKSDKKIIETALVNEKKNTLINLDNAIKLQQLKLIQDKKDAFSEVKYCCKICLENEIDIALIPCGHLFCSKCYNNREQYCYLCRTNIQDILKVYSN
jgi:hypothetical protein